jgi:hypothetical protein
MIIYKRIYNIETRNICEGGGSNRMYRKLMNNAGQEWEGKG